MTVTITLSDNDYFLLKELAEFGYNGLCEDEDMEKYDKLLAQLK
jgi:hypothetical protein